MLDRHHDGRDLDWTVFGGGLGETYRGTRGKDRLIGTDLGDTFRIGQGGRDRIDAGQGRDMIYVGAALTASDRVNGGAGYDILVLNGDYSSGLVLETSSVTRVEEVALRGNYEYFITLPAIIREDRGGIIIDGTDAQLIRVDGSNLSIYLGISGSAGDDIIEAGTADDGILAGLGADMLTGGLGSERFIYQSTSESLPSSSDVITDFDNDRFFMTQIDGDTQAPGDQNLHFGATPGRTGDVTITYDPGQDVTFVNVFTDSDTNPDMVIQLLGDHRDLTADNFFL